MKRFFSTFAFIVCNIALNAQHYIPFPDSNAYWRVDWFGGNCQDPLLYPRYQYRLAGDTSINGEIYIKLERSGICTQCCLAPYSPQDGYVGAYRQDTILKKVFFIQNGTTEEQLLYDFSLHVGDTIKGFLCSYQVGVTIYFIDSVLLDSVYHRRLNAGAVKLIEGIGSTQGLIEPLIDYDQAGWLICFNKNGEIEYYYNVLGDSCAIINGSEILTQSNFYPSVFPNPCKNRVSVNLNNLLSPDFLLTILDSKGMQLKAIIVQGNSVVIDFSDYPPGLYFYIIYLPSQKLYFSGKLIKVNL